MSTICKLTDVSFGYTSRKKILNKVSFEIKPGEIVGILGKNGSGKSTILNLITGFLSDYSGNITVKNKKISSYSLKERACAISYIQQKNFLIPEYYCIEDFIIDGRRPFRAFGFYKKEDYDLLDRIITICNLQNYRKHLLKELSGGEIQRCVFAKAIMKQSDFFLFDEPCSAMDIKYQKDFFEIASNVKKDLKAAVLLTIHDINLAVNNCDRLLVLDKGCIIFDGTASSVTSEIIAKAFDTNVSTNCSSKKYFYY